MATAPLNREDFLAGHFLLRHLCAEELGFPLEWRGGSERYAASLVIFSMQARG